MKKLLSLALAGVLLFSFSACGKDDTAYFEDVKASDYVTLGEYKNLTVSTKTLDDDWASTESSILSSNAKDEDIKDRVSASGDTVTYDATVKKAEDGTAIDSMKVSAATFVIGTTTETVTGLKDALTGKEVSDTPFDVTLTTGSDYSTDDTTLNNLSVIYTITITKITEKITPTELTDEMVASTTSQQYKTIADYKKYVREYYTTSLAWEQVKENATVEGYPKAELKQLYHDMLDQINTYVTNNYASAGYTFETFLPVSYGVDTYDEALVKVKEECITQVQENLIYLAIYDKEDLDYKDAYNELKKDDNYKDYAKNRLILAAKINTVSDFLMKNAKEGEVEEKTEDTDNTDATTAATTAPVEQTDATTAATTATTYDSDAAVKADE